jgi:hypothetical protein
MVAKAIQIRIPPAPDDSRYYMAGVVQWKPVDADTWYWMRQQLVEPESMKRRLIRVLEEASLERKVILILGEWDRSTKTMYVEEFIDD